MAVSLSTILYTLVLNIKIIRSVKIRWDVGDKDPKCNCLHS